MSAEQEVELRLDRGARGVRSLITRAVGIDEQALVRVRELGGGVLDVFVTTPFQVVAARRAQGVAPADGWVTAAAPLGQCLQTALDHADPQLDDAATVTAEQQGRGPEAQWPGALPPAEGFQLIDELPAHLVRQLSERGRSLARQFSGPLGPPASLMDQTVARVTSQGQDAEITMRMIFACTALGLIPADGRSGVPQHLRVSARGRWVRLDAPFGTVYYVPGGLNVFAL